MRQLVCDSRQLPKGCSLSKANALTCMAAAISAISGVHIWLATGHIDIRKGFATLALLVQKTLEDVASRVGGMTVAASACPTARRSRHRRRPAQRDLLWLR